MNEDPDEIFNDSPFTVMVNIGGDTEQLDIIPSLEAGVSVFTIILTGCELGDLSMNENEQWIWSDSNLSQDLADDIGCEIQKHYD